jgi:hypothetical protein
MANLTSVKIKDSYQSVLTTSETTSDPTTGTLQNGKGTTITSLSILGNVGVGGSGGSAKMQVTSSSDGDDVIRADTNSNSGVIILRPDGANGNVLRYGGGGANADVIRFLSGGDTERMRIDASGVVQPGADNAQTLGSASIRWSEIFAGNGTINTSDANDKQDIESLDEAEMAVAVALKSLVKKYRWKSSVESKGDSARIHVGLMAQDVEQAFIANGLDPEQYGVFCKDVWFTKEVTETVEVPNPSFDPEKKVSATNKETITETRTSVVGCEEEEGATRHERRGLRYDQVWAFIISAL